MDIQQDKKEVNFLKEFFIKILEPENKSSSRKSISPRGFLKYSRSALQPGSTPPVFKLP